MSGHGPGNTNTNSKEKAKKSSSIHIQEVTGDEPDDVSSPTFNVVEEEGRDFQSSSGESKDSSADALATYDPSFAAANQSRFSSATAQKIKSTDDSGIAFGDGLASKFGSKAYAPMPPPTAPGFQSEEEWQSFQAWMSATFADRTKFKNHSIYQDILVQGQERYTLDQKHIPEDSVSEVFRDQVNKNKIPHVNSGTGLPKSYVNMGFYVAPKHDSQMEVKDDHFDQVLAMIAYSESKFKTSFTSAAFGGNVIESNTFSIYSDHSGDSTGQNIQLWGAGAKQSKWGASLTSGSRLGQVHGTEEKYDVNLDYLHITNRLTIIRVKNNEIGFVWDRKSNHILKMKEGRYVILEHDYAYIGKTELVPNAKHVAKVAAHEKALATVKALAEALQVVLVTPGNVAFIKDNNNSYVLNEAVDPYVLDARRGEKFISCESRNQQLITAADKSYTLINSLMPGQFVIFQYEGRSIIWNYHPNDRLIHLPSNIFGTNVEMHSLSKADVISKPNLDVVIMNPGDVAVVQDEKRQTRFIENADAAMIVLRTPWKHIKVISQNESSYKSEPNALSKNSISRVMLRSSEWAAVLDKSGRLVFFPPRFDNVPYYFQQPEYTLIKVINKNQQGANELNVPGVGKVSVVNIPTGSLGKARIQNAYFFLNPSQSPLVFVEPDVYLGEVDSKQAHTEIGDLHRIVLQPNERAVVSKDGQLYCIPSREGEKTREALSEQNGVYVFRAFQFKLEGPKLKSEKVYDLGPIKYFNVGVGEVAYGNVNGEFTIWRGGEHSVDSRQNEWFTGFFQTNVDPVELKKMPVTFKHGITGTVDVYVQYKIADPSKTIQQIGNHEALHSFIEKTTAAEMIKLCSGRPPLGYSDSYFETESKKYPASETEDDAALRSADEIQKSFVRHAKELLDEYGVHISNMYIDKWDLAEDFVKQVQDSAKRLQVQHADIEQQRMALEQKRLENEKELNKRKAETEFEKQQNETDLLHIQMDARKKIVIAESAAQQKLMEAKATAEALKMKIEMDALLNESKASGEAKATEQQARGAAMALMVKADQERENALKQAKNAEQIAEFNARASTATQRVQAETAVAVALNNKQIYEIENANLRVKGEIEGANAGLKSAAAYHGLSPDQMLQLRLAEVQTKAMLEFAATLAKAGVNMPGVVTLDPNLLQILQMPRMMNGAFPMMPGSMTTGMQAGLTFMPVSSVNSGANVNAKNTAPKTPDQDGVNTLELKN